MPEKFSTFRDVIELWPRRAALARFIPATSASAVRSWWSMDFIPEKKFMAVVAAAETCGFEGVTYSMLAGLRPGRATLPPTALKEP